MSMPPTLADIAALPRCCATTPRCAQADGDWQLDGDPTEGALLTLALQGRARPRASRREDAAAHRRHPVRVRAPLHGDAASRPRRPRLRLSSRARRSASSACAPDSARPVTDEPLDPAFWHARIETLAARGPARAGAGAACPCRKRKRELAFADVEAGLTLLGAGRHHRPAARGGDRAPWRPAARPASASR